jgi:hypothetical protein
MTLALLMGASAPGADDGAGAAQDWSITKGG